MDEIIENLNEGQENVVDSQETEQVTEPIESEDTEAATVQQEEKPVQDAETNARFAEVRRKTEAEAKDKLISEMYGESYGIHTYAEYQAAIEQQKEQESLAKLQEEQNIPEEIAKELLEAKKLKEEISKERTQREQKEKEQKDIQDFVQMFPDIKGEDIPQEVWLKVKEGVPLKYAYMETQYSKINEGKKVLQQNQANAEASTGSMKGKLDISNDHITFEDFESKKHDQSWVMKNYNKIQSSRSKW